MFKKSTSSTISPFNNQIYIQPSIHETQSYNEKLEEYKHTPGRPGGGWDFDESQNRSKSSLSPDQIIANPSNPAIRPNHIITSQPLQENPEFSYQNNSSDDYEKSLIDSITTSEGVRIRPSDKDLHQFISKCKYLNPEIVIQLLINLLENPQRSLKALIVIERLAFEYENYVNIIGVNKNLTKIQKAAKNQAGMKIVKNIFSKYNRNVDGTRENTEIINLF
ncbi:hypothetical protein SteCoe_32299 [Stentor coeruleus]|uniref:VHS domain-containing protein n=1 Tax=Stentor coeruleus TaxID=5963 RepID=A0A1R2AZC9_9CILI|nr:hypothetical protein SteCoe_32299 [Stentor coeruleus]